MVNATFSNILYESYPKLIINNNPGSTTVVDVKESTGYKERLQSTLALIKHYLHLKNAALYE